MIFKFQRPLFSTDFPTEILVYDKAREFETMLPATPELLALFGDEVKFFAECEVTPQKSGFRLTITSKISDPHW